MSPHKTHRYPPYLVRARLLTRAMRAAVVAAVQLYRAHPVPRTVPQIALLIVRPVHPVLRAAPQVLSRVLTANKTQPLAIVTVHKVALKHLTRQPMPRQSAQLTRAKPMPQTQRASLLMQSKVAKSQQGGPNKGLKTVSGG